MSYNDLTLTKKEGIYITVPGSPDPRMVPYFTAAKALGCQVAMVSALQEETLQKALQNPGLDFVIAEGNSTTLQKILSLIYDARFAEKKMKTILTPLDAPSVASPEKYFEPFVQVRSLAINTMRHGAPLEIA